MIDRLESSQFTFEGGHIYYNNNVIKIRYDLIDKFGGDNYNELEIFDQYDNIFDLQQGERVKSNTPLDSIRSQRFAYVITDKKNCKPINLYILPYLHSKFIFLNRNKTNTDYFYTSIETKIHNNDK